MTYIRIDCKLEYLYELVSFIPELSSSTPNLFPNTGTESFTWETATLSSTHTPSVARSTT